MRKIENSDSTSTYAVELEKNLTSKNFLRELFALFVHVMWSLGTNIKRTICFFLEAVMLTLIFTYSWSFNAPNTESKASFEAASGQHFVFRNTSGASELTNELVSKIQLVVNDLHEVSIDIPGIAIATSDGFNVNASLRNPFYAYTTINAP
jgi:hypothetical protein